jgi:hypothetical protein
MGQNNPAGLENSGTTAASHEQTVLIPALLTNSLRAILSEFGADIYQLTAHGSTTTTNRSTIDDLREYGTTIEQCNTHTVKIDYERLTDRDGEVQNPLTEDVIQRILDEIDTQLNTEDLSVAPDLAVTSLTLRVADERLAEVTPAQTDEFDLRFSADPAEDSLRDLTERVNLGRGLYDELGFDRTHLNLRSATETATKYSGQSDGRYIRWHGPDDIRPRTSAPLAARINTHSLPDDYAILKPYKVVEDNLLDIDEEELDDDVPGAPERTEGAK